MEEITFDLGASLPIKITQNFTPIKKIALKIILMALELRREYDLKPRVEYANIRLDPTSTVDSKNFLIEF